MQKDFDITEADVQWVITSYMLVWASPGLSCAVFVNLI